MSEETISHDEGEFTEVWRFCQPSRIFELNAS